MVWDALEIIDALIPVKSAKCKGLLLPGVGGHSVHGLEDQWCPGQPSDGGGQNWVADRGDVRIVLKISGLGCVYVA